MQIRKIKCLANQERMLCLQSYTVNVAQCKSVDSDLRCLSPRKKKLWIGTVFYTRVMYDEQINSMTYKNMYTH